MYLLYRPTPSNIAFGATISTRPSLVFRSTDFLIVGTASRHMRPRCVEQHLFANCYYVITSFENIDRPTDWKWSFNYAGEFSQIEPAHVATSFERKRMENLGTFVVTRSVEFSVRPSFPFVHCRSRTSGEQTRGTNGQILGPLKTDLL